MSDAFEEYAGSGVDYNLGLMQKSKFKSLMAGARPAPETTDRARSPARRRPRACVSPARPCCVGRSALQ